MHRDACSEIPEPAQHGAFFVGPVYAVQKLACVRGIRGKYEMVEFPTVPCGIQDDEALTGWPDALDVNA
jgi:hypothetical protein